jgi:hypothetical protein
MRATPPLTADNSSNPMVRDDVPAGQADSTIPSTPMANACLASRFLVPPTTSFLPVRTDNPYRASPQCLLPANNHAHLSRGISRRSYVLVVPVGLGRPITQRYTRGGC